MSARVVSDPFEAAVVEAMPRLRSFALKLCRSGHEADDLVQDTVVAALRKRDSYRPQPGRPLASWLIVILRNHFINRLRTARRHGEHQLDLDSPGVMARTAIYAPQDLHVALADMTRAIDHLSPVMRHALLAMTDTDRSYADYAASVGIAEGTAKSRVFRARRMIAEVLP